MYENENKFSSVQLCGSRVAVVKVGLPLLSPPFKNTDIKFSNKKENRYLQEFCFVFIEFFLSLNFAYRYYTFCTKYRCRFLIAIYTAVGSYLDAIASNNVNTTHIYIPRSVRQVAADNLLLKIIYRPPSPGKTDNLCIINATIVYGTIIYFVYFSCLKFYQIIFHINIIKNKNDD